jgi:ribonuclease P protein component
MTSGSQAICAAAVFPVRAFVVPCRTRAAREMYMADGAPNPQLDWPHARLRKHAEYQRVYQASRKQFSPSMTYFFRMRSEDELTPAYSGPRVGLTAGRVLGKAVDRNRIKRRMREAAWMNLAVLPQYADVVLHPRRLVLDIEFAKLEREVAKVFSTVFSQVGKIQPRETGAQA